MIFLGAFLLPENALIEMDSQVLGQFTLTLPLIVLFIARAADGITGGNVSVANAYLADITDEDQRNQNFGKMAVSSWRFRAECLNVFSFKFFHFCVHIDNLKYT